MEKHPKIIIAICIVVSALSLGYIAMVGKPSKRVTEPVPISTPGIVKSVNADSPREWEVESPDGKWVIKGKEVRNENSLSYIFTKDGKTIFTKILPLGSSISVPLNTFSPNGKYVFLIERSPAGTLYHLATEDGSIEVSEVFYEKFPDYVITDITGWGSYSNLVVNTNSKDGSLGPTFWFEAGSHYISKLSTRFN